jgi:thioredoxin-related protein
MKKIIYLSLIVALFSCSSKNTVQNNTPDKTAVVSNSTKTVNTETAAKPAETVITPVEVEKDKGEIKWLTYDEAVKLSKKKPKKIFIDVYTDWCGWCKKMDKTTFLDPKIMEYMNSKYYAVKLNAESNNPVSFQGKMMTESQLAGSVFKITGYPSTVYLESDEKIIQPVPGYMDVVTLDKLLHYVAGDYYKTLTWEQFQLSYKSE